MENKKLRKIKRRELLEIMLEQAKRIEELESELAKTKESLNSKKIIIAESGNLAEASLKLNEIFEVAQQVADDYVYNIKENCKKLESKTKKECRTYKSNALKKVELECQKKKKEADEYFSEMEQKGMELLKKSTGKKKTKATKKINKNTDTNLIEENESEDNNLKNDKSKVLSTTRKNFRKKKG